MCLEPQLSYIKKLLIALFVCCNMFALQAGDFKLIYY